MNVNKPLELSTASQALLDQLRYYIGASFNPAGPFDSTLEALSAGGALPGQVIYLRDGSVVKAQGDAYKIAFFGDSITAYNTVYRNDIKITDVNGFGLVYKPRPTATNPSEITVAHINPGGNNSTIGVLVDGNHITVTLSCAAGVINCTATAVHDAVVSNPAADALVIVNFFDTSPTPTKLAIAQAITYAIPGSYQAANGVGVWLQTLMYQRFSFCRRFHLYSSTGQFNGDQEGDWTFGYPGQRADQLLGNPGPMGDVLASDADLIVGMAGTNDFIHGDDVPTTYARIIALWDALTKAGRRFIWLETAPSGDAARQTKTDALNVLLRVEALNRGLALLPWKTSFVVSGAALPIYFPDQIHPSDQACYEQAVAWEAIFENFIQHVRPSFDNPSDPNWITANPGMVGNASGIATGWTNSSPSMITPSKVLATDGGNDWQQLVVNQTAGQYNEARFSCTFATSGFQVGDIVDALGEFECDQAGWDVKAVVVTIYAQGASTSQLNSALQAFSYDQYSWQGTNKPFSGIPRTPPMATPHGTTGLGMTIIIYGRGTLRFRNAGVRFSDQPYLPKVPVGRQTAQAQAIAFGSHPYNASGAGSATILATMIPAPLDGDTSTYGTTTYTWKTTPTTILQIGLGDGTPAVLAANLVAAIAGTDGRNTAHPLVTAAIIDTPATQVQITAKVPGVAGNTIPVSRTSTGAILGLNYPRTLPTTLLGGAEAITATPGKFGDLRIDDSGAQMFVSAGNWKGIPLSDPANPIAYVTEAELLDTAQSITNFYRRQNLFWMHRQVMDFTDITQSSIGKWVSFCVGGDSVASATGFNGPVNDEGIRRYGLGNFSSRTFAGLGYNNGANQFGANVESDEYTGTVVRQQGVTSFYAKYLPNCQYYEMASGSTITQSTYDKAVATGYYKIMCFYAITAGGGTLTFAVTQPGSATPITPKVVNTATGVVGNIGVVEFTSADGLALNGIPTVVISATGATCHFIGVQVLMEKGWVSSALQYGGTSIANQWVCPDANLSLFVSKMNVGMISYAFKEEDLSGFDLQTLMLRMQRLFPNVSHMWNGPTPSTQDNYQNLVIGGVMKSIAEELGHAYNDFYQLAGGDPILLRQLGWAEDPSYNSGVLDGPHLNPRAWRFLASCLVKAVLVLDPLDSYQAPVTRAQMRYRQLTHSSGRTLPVVTSLPSQVKPSSGTLWTSDSAAGEVGYFSNSSSPTTPSASSEWGIQLARDARWRGNYDFQASWSQGLNLASGQTAGPAFGVTNYNTTDAGGALASGIYSLGEQGLWIQICDGETLPFVRMLLHDGTTCFVSPNFYLPLAPGVGKGYIQGSQADPWHNFSVHYISNGSSLNKQVILRMGPDHPSNAANQPGVTPYVVADWRQTVGNGSSFNNTRGGVMFRCTTNASPGVAFFPSAKIYSMRIGGGFEADVYP